MSLSLVAKRLTATSRYVQSGNLLVLLDNVGAVTWFGVGYILTHPGPEEKLQQWMRKGWE